MYKKKNPKTHKLTIVKKSKQKTKRSIKQKKKNKIQHKRESPQKNHRVSSCADRPLLVMGPGPQCSQHTEGCSVGKTDPPPWEWSSSANTLLIGIEVHVCFLSQHRDPIWLEQLQVLHMMAHVLWIHMCVSPTVSGRHCFLTIIGILPTLSLSSEGKGMMKMFHLGLSALSLSLSARIQIQL